MSQETIWEVPGFRVTPHLIQAGPSSIAVRQINSVTIESVDYGRKTMEAWKTLTVTINGGIGFVVFVVALQTMIGADGLRPDGSGPRPMLGLFLLGISGAFCLAAIGFFKWARRELGTRWEHTVVATTSNGQSKLFTHQDLGVALEAHAAIEAAITHPAQTAARS